MSDVKPIILWFRRDFRLSDHPALCEACKSGRPIIPVVLLDEVSNTFGAASKWRMSKAIEHFDEVLRKIGSRLILRRGTAATELLNLAKETGAEDIWWSRAYDPDAIERDTRAKSELKRAGLKAKSWAGHILFEPWAIATKKGGFYQVYSPMWRAVKDLDVALPGAAPERLAAPENWPVSDQLPDWALEKGMEYGGRVLN